MLEMIKSGGWLMLPILLCSVLALAIILERFWTLRPSKIAPKNLLSEVWGWIRSNQLSAERMKELRTKTPLGRILAAGLSNSKYGRDIMKESIQEVASHVIHEMERYLNTLGTIALITPLLGLLGTVIGMIKVFTAIMIQGTGNASVLAGGISEALITTAAGLSVAIPTLIFHRVFQRRIDELVVDMEQEAVKLVDVFHGDRGKEDNATKRGE
ncbi:MAG: MotA/TolQ/ExbB proton channel family protein [Pseudomonadales bacterium]|nr:MotA/TolQ/ExbB proton channel family protein [Pseudomonadales bacterium]